MLDNNNNIFDTDNEAEQNSKIADIKNSVKEIGNSLEQIFETLRPKTNFDDFLCVTSEYIDKIIIQTCQKENLLFVAGTCEFSISKEKKHLEIKADLYYKNASEQWVQKMIKGKTAISRFDENTQRITLKKIYQEGMKIDIESPIS